MAIIALDPFVQRSMSRKANRYHGVYLRYERNLLFSLRQCFAISLFELLLEVWQDWHVVLGERQEQNQY